MKLVIEGAPRTKKNHTRRIRRGTRVFTVQSEAHEAWEAAAIPQLRRQMIGVITTVDRARGLVVQGGAFDCPMAMRAIVYRDRNVGDLVNYLGAICDVLQPKYKKVGSARVCWWQGVITDDKLIVSVDGSRLLLDRKRPRVEIELTVAT